MKFDRLKHTVRADRLNAHHVNMKQKKTPMDHIFFLPLQKECLYWLHNEIRWNENRVVVFFTAMSEQNIHKA